MGTASQETAHVTGTKDKDYNLIWFVEQCLSDALRLETYIQDAERDGDAELADFFPPRPGGESQGGRARQGAPAQAPGWLSGMSREPDPTDYGLPSIGVNSH
jgi:hypothetical protein